MKRIIIKGAFMAIMLMCGTTANAQFNLGNILGGLANGQTATTDSVSSGSSTSGLGDLVSGLTTIFSGEKQADKKSIVGMWTYSEPAIVFESDNFLAKTGAKIAAGKLEDKLQERLTKVGIKPGAVTFTFNEDGTYVNTLGSKKFAGTWTVTDQKLNLTVAKMKTFSITTQLEGKQLMLVVNADKLLTFVKTMTGKSENSNMKTVSTLLKSIKGAEAGITLEKQ